MTLETTMETNNSLTGNFSLLCISKTDRERSDDFRSSILILVFEIYSFKNSTSLNRI